MLAHDYIGAIQQTPVLRLVDKQDCSVLPGCMVLSHISDASNSSRKADPCPGASQSMRVVLQEV